MAQARAVTVIPPKINPHTRMSTTAMTKRRTAAYARVSTDSDEQFTSYEAQIDYYTQYIQRHSDWEFVKVYTDEGISATNTKHRDGFNEMIEDALNGKIDLIVTKSVSRFARNTVDSLVTVRKLKAKGIEVYFEKENIYTLDSKGELLITIMSSLAQEESRSISENVTWGQRKRFSDGKVSLPYKQFLGYEKGSDGFPKIVPDEAAIIRRIYSSFMSGKTPFTIAKMLTTEGIVTPSGKSLWQASTIESILTNEKYKGSAILQKRFTVDFLTKKMKVNEGEVPQYVVEHSHDAIIDPEEWEAVQAEFGRRKKLGRQYSGNSVFAAKIICGDCGAFYGSKVWHSTSKYRRTVWQCNNKFRNGEKCATPHFDEQEIKARFLAVFNVLITTKETLLDDCRAIQNMLTDVSDIDAEAVSLKQEIEVITELTKKCISENSQSIQNQEDYKRKYDSYVERYDAAKEKLDRLEKQKNERLIKSDAIGGFMFELSERSETLTEFDDRLWLTIIDTVTAYRDGRLIFKFHNGSEIEG